MNNKTKPEPRVLLMIPCFNEEANIGLLLQEIQQLELNCDTIVIDDGSIDNTYKIASMYSPCIKLVNNLGIGGAVQTAIKYSLRNQYDLCIQVDGDGQHPPDQIKKLLDTYSNIGANITIGSRFLGDGEFQSTRLRRFGIWVINQTIKRLFNFSVTDATSGFRLLDRKAIQLFSRQYPYDYPEPISIGLALENQLNICEVPVRMRSRNYGQSSIGGIKNGLYMLRVAGYLCLIKLGKYF